MGGYGMTREEEIRKQALKYGEPEYLLQTPNILGTQGFIQGVKWADKTIIEKACKWLEEKNKMCMYELEMILGGSFINDFKRYLEE